MSDSQTATVKVPAYHPSQAIIAAESRRFNVLAMGRRYGKALALDTPIPTPQGWKTLHEVREGDYVFGADGRPTAVTFATEIMYDHTCYKVLFSDGSEIVADADHQWCTWTHAARKAAGRSRGGVAKTPLLTQPQVRTTTEIRDTLTQGKRQDVNHSVRLCGPLAYPERELPVDPYVLGVWLGDGTSACSDVTTMDEEVLEHLRQAGHRVTRKKSDNSGRASIYMVGGGSRGGVSDGTCLTARLRAIGVLGNKHVPTRYLHASIPQRTALLQGLMDTDGTIGVRGNCTFDNTRKCLSDAVYELAVSLGYKPTRQQRPAMLNGQQYGVAYRVFFTPHGPVFRLSRKLSRQKLSAVKPTQHHRYIVNVQEVPSVPVKCIAVEADDHLFLAGTTCIATHNTTYGTRRLLLPALQGYPVAWFAPNYKLLAEVWLDVKNRVKPIAKRVSNQEKRIELITGGVIDMWSLDGDIVVRGRRYKHVGVDEAAFVPNLGQVWTKAILPTLADYSGSADFYSTPNGLNHFHTLYQLGQDPEIQDWKSWTRTTYDNPYINPAEIEVLRANMSEKAFQQEIMAEFLADGTAVFRYVQQAATAEPMGPISGRHYAIGVDWGRTDFTVFIVMDIATKTMVHMERTNQLEFALQRGRLLALCERYKPDALVIEENSIGFPIIEQLKRDKLYVTPFVTTNSSKMRIIDNLALHFERGAIKILNDHTLIHELLAFQPTKLPSGLIRYAAPDGMNDDCVPGGTLIRTDRGMVPIEEVVVGDEVLTHMGRYRPVTQLGQRYASSVFNVTATGRPTLSLTGNHSMLLYPRQLERAGRVNTLKHGTAEWVSVDTGADLLHKATCSVASTETHDVETVDLLPYCGPTYHDEDGHLAATTHGGTRLNAKQNFMQRYLAVDEDFCRLLGYYAAEGSSGPHTVIWASHAREEPVREWLVDYLQRLGLHPCIHTGSRDRGYRVSAGSMPLRGYFSSEVGSHNAKRLPRWVETLPESKQWQVLIGWLLGDGSFTSGQCKAATISPTLAAQMHEIAIRLGVPCGVRTYEGQNGHKRQWVLRFGIPATRRIVSAIGPTLMASKIYADKPIVNDQTTLRFADARLVGKIRRVEEIAHDDIVYNLEVEEDHSYVANFTVVHNCVMSLAFTLEACGRPDGYLEYLRGRAEAIKQAQEEQESVLARAA